MKQSKSKTRNQRWIATEKRAERQTNWLHMLIDETTGAPENDIGQIETIMREDIFHTTLDWQTRQQLADAARDAYELLMANRELYKAR